MDYANFLTELNSMCEKYSEFSVNGIGESIMGRGIHSVSVGKGKNKIIYIGAQNGCDCSVSFALLHFIREYCSMLESKSKLFGLPIDYIDQKVTIVTIPILNPDGIEYVQHGVDDNNPIYQRLISMNKGEDFGKWSSNGRGVDLRRNYNCGFEEYKNMTISQGLINGGPEGYPGEYPESEPEVGHLCNYIRYTDGIAGIIELMGNGSGISTSGDKNMRKSKALSEMLGYFNISEEAEECSFQHWCRIEKGIPSFAVGCDIQDFNEDPFVIYTRIRKMLFCAPMLF